MRGWLVNDPNVAAVVDLCVELFPVPVFFLENPQQCLDCTTLFFVDQRVAHVLSFSAGE